ncbi:TPA: hypothetical protein ACHHV5_000956, partial [Staphylococcus aureus]
MTERKCTCNKPFSILVRGPNTEADEKSAYNNVQVGVWAPTKRISKRNSTGNASWGVGPNKENFEKKFYRQCKLGMGPNKENF